MVKFFLFLKKIYVFLLFVILEIFALNFYANSTDYTKAKLLTASNTMVGGVYKTFSDVTDYFGMRSENDMLLKRIAELENSLDIYKTTKGREIDDPDTDLTDLQRYIYTTAAVINSSITRQENTVTLDKGRRDGVEPNMAMITPQGSIVGYVIGASEKFSVGISILNTNFRTSGKVLDKDCFGSVFWDGLNHEYVTLSEIPKYAQLEKGDTVLTDYSSIFPPDILIGTVESFELHQSGYYDVKVKLATPMSALKNILLVRYADIVERMLLEEEITY